MSEETIEHKIQAAIDEAWPTAMALSEADFQLEIDRRLDVLAVGFMAKRPDLPTMSLDDWLAEHHEKLSEKERLDAIAILDAYGSTPTDQGVSPSPD